MDKLKFTPFFKQCIAISAVCSSIVCNVGFVFGFPGVLLPALHQPDSEILLTKVQDSWIASVVSVSMLIGNFITPSVMDRYGRKVAHILASVPALVGWFLMAAGINTEMLIVARFLQGLSGGLILPLRSVLVGEYSSPKYRGGFLTTISLAQGLGIFVVHLIGSVLSWKLTSVICGVVTFISLIMAFYLPESPSWLAVKGRYDDSRNAFRWLRGDDEEKELEELIQSRIKFRIEHEKQKKGTIVNRLNTLGSNVKKREFYLPVIIIAHCYVMIQVCGNVTMPAFSVEIIKIMMGSEANAHVWMVILDSLRIAANVLAVFVIHKFKRRTILFGAGAVCTVVHIGIAAYVYARTNAMLSFNSVWIPGCLIVLQFLCIGLGIVPMPTVIAGEVMPLQFRSTISSIGIVVLTVLMFIILKSFPLLLDGIGLDGTYAIYSAVMMYVFAVLWFVLPETSGKTLQEIENELKGKGLRTEDIEAKVDLKTGTKVDDNDESK